MNCDTSVLEQRTNVSLTALDAIHKITVKMDTLPVGTFKYKIFKYPSDIDIFEKLDDCCSYNQVRLRSAKSIQQIVQKIQKSENVIFKELKAGYDNRFKVYTGYVINNTIFDYNPSVIRRDIDRLYTAKLILKDKYNLLNDLIIDNIDLETFAELNEELRKLWLLRWSETEVLQGYKILPGNFALYLDEAIVMGSIVKIDTYAKLAKRYIEMSNFFFIEVNDRLLGKRQILTEDLGDYADSLLHDVYQYYGKSTLKAVKRLWMYLAFKNDICDLDMFRDLFTGPIAKLSQIAADIQTALDLYKNRGTLKYDQVFLYESILNRIKELKELGVSCNYEFLNDILDCLNTQVNDMTLEWLKDRNIDVYQLMGSL